MNGTAPAPPITKAEQQVRYVGSSGVIAHGSVGTVQRMHDVLTDCPIVHFPKGTHGPHDTFVITRPEEDLEQVAEVSA